MSNIITSVPQKPETPVTLPVGYHQFHKSQVYNYQLNRFYSLGFFKFEDIAHIGERISSFADWTTEMEKLAEKAQAENRLLNAAFYYRAAEFYTLNKDHPGKEFYYDRFIDLFYQAVVGESFERLTRALRFRFSANHSHRACGRENRHAGNAWGV